MLAALATALPAAGEPIRSPQIEWNAPQACPTQADFLARVERFLRASLESRRDQHVAIAVRVELVENQGRYGASIHVDTPRGLRERQLVHDDCNELMEGAALVAALAIDPHLVVADEPSEQATPAEPAEPPRESRDMPATAANPGAPSPQALRAPLQGAAPIAVAERHPTGGQAPSHWQTSTSAYGLVGNGGLPDIGPGLGLRLESGRGHFRGAVQATYWLTRFVGVADAQPSGIELRAFSVGLRACWVPLLGRWTVGACLGPELGSLHGQGVDLEAAHAGSDRFSALMTDISAVFTPSVDGTGVGAELGLATGAALERPRFGITRDGREEETFEAPRLLVHGHLGLRYTFGTAK